MKCVYKNTPIEILGYNINIEKFKKSKNLGNMEEKHLKVQQQYLEFLKETGNKIGLKFKQDLRIDGRKMQYASDKFQEEILKYPENKEILRKNHIEIEPNFYRTQQCNPNSIFYINETMNFPNVEEMVQEIQAAEGYAFLAHAYIYPFYDTLAEVEEIIKNTKIDGIECYYSYFNVNQTQSLIKLCKKYKLYQSGGSDFHGKNRPDTRNGSRNRKLKNRKNNYRKLVKKLSKCKIRRKKMLSIIVAKAKNNIIGKENKMVWHLPADLQHFKEITTGHVIIMGRKTFESLGKVLPNRKHIVFSQNPDFKVNDENVQVVHSMLEIQEYIENEEENFVIGGAMIYNLLMPHVTKMYVTQIEEEFEGDCFFPVINTETWREVSRQKGLKNEENNLDYDFVNYERIEQKK